MDPSKMLEEIRSIIAEVNEPGHTNGPYHGILLARKLVENITALDTHIMEGGVLPKDWAQAYAQAVAEKEV